MGNPPPNNPPWAASATRFHSTPAPSLNTPTSLPQLTPQHTRLLLDLLPFSSQSQFQTYLSSPHLLGCFTEFHTSFLAHNPTAPEPDKKDWTAEDHHVRFIVQVVSDGLLKGMWNESEFKKKGIDIAKAAYEILSFMRGMHMVDNNSPPGYSA